VGPELSRTAHLRAIALILALALPAASAARGSLAAWADSPAQYLLNDGQRSEFRALSTEDARLDYIATFWSTLEPDPTSADNVARATFDARVAEANRRYREAGVPGWRTDRGHVLIVWGPPDDELEDIEQQRERLQQLLQDPEAATSSAGRATRLVWTYLQPPGHAGRQDLVFEQNTRGGFRLVTATDLRWGLRTPPSAPPTERATEEPVDDDARDVARLLDRSRRGRSVRASHMQSRALVYPSGVAETLVVVAFALDRIDTPTSLELIGAAYDGDARRPEHAWRMPFRAPSDSRQAVRSFATLLPFGRWHLELVIRAEGGKEPLALDDLDVDVPDFESGRLTSSSLLLAQGFRMLDSAEVRFNEVVEGIVVGKVAIDAVATLNVPREPAPQVFLVVAGAGGNDGELNIGARFRVLGADGVARVVRRAQVARTFHAQPIPIANLAAGVYRLEVDLEDHTTGQRTTAELAFDLD